MNENDDFSSLLSEEEEKELNEEGNQYIGEPKLIAIIGDEDTCAGFILAGIGQLDEDQNPNYFVVDRKTDEFHLELIFLDMIERQDIGLILITREAAEKITPVLNQYKGIEPTVMIIPGHNGPYEFDLPLAVKNIEEEREAACSRRGSSTTSIKTIESIHAPIGLPKKKLSSHSLRSMRS